MSKPIERRYWPTPKGWKVSVVRVEMGPRYEMIAVNIGAAAELAARCCGRTARRPTRRDGPCSANAEGAWYPRYD